MTSESRRLLVDRPQGTAAGAEPATFGIPWARGELAASRADAVAIIGEDGSGWPTQTRVLELWPDGTVRWLLLDTMVGASSTASVFVGRRPTPPPEPVTARRTANGVLLETAGLAVEVAGNGGHLFRRFESAGCGLPAIDLEESGPYCRVDGVDRPFLIDSAVIEASGPVRATVGIEARFPLDPRPGGPPHLAIGLTISLFAGTGTLRLECRVANPAAASHPGGVWELGGEGSVIVEGLGLEIRSPAPSTVATALSVDAEDDDSLEDSRPGRGVRVHQESSGGSNWRSPTHVDRFGVVPHRFRGFRGHRGETSIEGDRASPICRYVDQSVVVTGAVADFWPNFPSALEVSPRGAMRLELFPLDWPNGHEIQGGEAKTHRLFLAVDPVGAPSTSLRWAHEGALLHLDAAAYAQATAMPLLTPEDDDPNRGYVDLVREGLAGPRSLAAKREVIDEYGWRNFGDIPADHEAVYAPDPEHFVSHYNNQYDAVRGFALQFFRRGSRSDHQQMTDLARHVLDIDLYHTDCDRSVYNHGLFWHTAHYVDAGRSTHRSYPSSELGVGGGPSTGHLYSTGLLLYHLLTGCPRARAAVVSMGQYVIDADDGRLGRFRLIDRQATGHVSESGFDRYHGPGRSPGNAINTLVDAHRLTAEPAFLSKAEALIRRTIHPTDDVEGRNLLDAENRWFYTLYLQALERYLEHKAVLGENDEMYAYAHESLLRYARWAVHHEYPYLDRPHILEYPNETWSAQDMRKSEVFNAASRLVQGEEREAFLGAGRRFHAESVSRLAASPTRTLARPMVLLLSHGHRQAAFDRLPPEATRLPSPIAVPGSWPEPVAFEAQKVRVIRRLGWGVGLSGATMVLLAGRWLRGRRRSVG